jgi:hypothetical protein
MSLPSFETIWQRIEALQGEDFTTITGLPFTYRIDGRALFPSRTSYRLSFGNFEKAYSLVPFPSPATISEKVRGPSYVWAILHDPRVTRGAWSTGQ